MLPKVIRKVKRFLGNLGFFEWLTVLVIMCYLFYTGIVINYEAKRLQVTSAKSSTLFSIPPKRSFNQEGTLTTTPRPTTPLYSALPIKKPAMQKCSVTIAIILCEDDRVLAITKNKTNSSSLNPPASGKLIAKDFSRQINQTLVLLKSIAILSKYEQHQHSSSCVEALLLSDKPQHYQQIKAEMRKKWSTEFQQLIKVTNVPVRYPPGSAWMKRMFRPCATLRLFLAELLPEWDAVIYVDTDLIFFQSVQSLWGEFERFEEENGEKSEESGDGTVIVAALAPCLFHYGSSANEVPYFGNSGLNAGIMLMNLTRMRGSQWTNKIRMVTTMFQDKIKLADQDILNIYFHFFPEELHMLTCDWNFRPFQCREGSTCEDPEIGQGISALHGNALSFTPQGPEPLFHAVFQTFHRTRLDNGFKLKRFVEQLERSLLAAEEAAHKYSSPCKQFGGLDVLLLNRLYSLIER